MESLRRMKMFVLFVHIYILSWTGRRQDVAWSRVVDGLKEDKRLIVFLVPPKGTISGGILSIFSLAKASRLFRDIHGANVLIATFPAANSYICNDQFKNDETVFRFSQICAIAADLDSLVLHIPEFLVSKFYRMLSDKEREILSKLKLFHINIMNQNSQLMSEPSVLVDLRKLTNKITQTVAHYKSATAENIRKYGIPSHLIPAYIDISMYGKTDYHQKENLIAYSNDECAEKTWVLQSLKKALPDYKFIEIHGMKFTRYVDTITRAKYTISFGEGFDAYLMQPLEVGSLGIAVYNEVFFPSPELRKWENIFESYSDLVENFPKLVDAHLKNSGLYRSLVADFLERLQGWYDPNDYQARIRNFYLHKYDYFC